MDLRTFLRDAARFELLACNSHVELARITTAMQQQEIVTMMENDDATLLSTIPMPAPAVIITVSAVLK